MRQFANPDTVKLGDRLFGERADLDRLLGGAAAAPTRVVTSAGQTVKSGPGLLYGIRIIVPGTPGTIDVYDNTSASGQKRMAIPAAKVTADNWIDFGGMGAFFANGCHVVVGGTGVEADVYAV